MTQTNGRTVLVIGSTGQQGGKVVNALLEAGGWNVRGLTRDATSEKAQALVSRGVELAQGDMDDVASLEAAMQGAYGVYSVQSVGGRGVDVEIQEGKNVADAAKKAGVSHLVFSGVSGGNRKIGVPNFESKGAIEEHIRSIDIPHTILRPVSFMDNFNRNRDAIQSGKLSGILSPDKPQWFTAVRNIADFAVAALSRPDDFLGQAIDLAGDSMTLPQAAEVFTRVLGRSVEYNHILPQQRDRIAPPMKVMNEFYEGEGYGVDVAALRGRWGIPILNLEDWVRQEPGWLS